MQIKLLKMTIENFKGIKRFEFVPNGENAIVQAKNGCGKTTLADAFYWCLFDKDSHGNKDFDIKTIDKGDHIHNLIHQVYIILSVDGDEIELEKTFTEKWTKKRGSSESEFTGHTTDYKINGVPVKMAEYKHKISEIVSEDIFKLITNPFHFAGLHWHKRREIVTQICGEPNINDIIQSSPGLEEIQEICNKTSVDDQLKILKARSKAINEKIDGIPLRIDEQRRSMQELIQFDPSEKINIQESIDRINKDIASLSSKDISIDLLRQKRVLEFKIQTYEDQKRKEAEFYNRATAEKTNMIKALNAGIKELELRNADLRTNFNRIKSEQIATDGTCSTCGQTLPKDQINSQISKFNLGKSVKLETIQKEGVSNKDRIEGLKKELEKVESENSVFTGDIPDIEALNNEMGKINTKLEKVDNEELERKKQELEQQRIELQNKFEEIQKAEAMVDAAKKAEDRIQELQKELKDLGLEFGKCMKEIDIIERFTRAKVAMVESEIENHFKYVRFRMFENQINGGISECCDIVNQNGTPYQDLSNSEKINAGLDILSTISKKYDIYGPVWIDNAESITKTIDIDSQVVKLVVDPEFETLTWS